MMLRNLEKIKKKIFQQQNELKIKKTISFVFQRIEYCEIS